MLDLFAMVQCYELYSCALKCCIEMRISLLDYLRWRLPQCVEMMQNLQSCFCLYSIRIDWNMLVMHLRLFMCGLLLMLLLCLSRLARMGACYFFFLFSLYKQNSKTCGVGGRMFIGK